MKLDADPSLICMTYSTPEEYTKLLKFLKSNNLPVREIKLLDITIPLDSEYDSKINLLKHFIMPNYWKDRSPLNALNHVPTMFKGIVNSAISKSGFTPLNMNWDWENDNRHELLYTLLCPLAIQDKTKYCETEQELKNMEKLKSFSSEGYKPSITGVHD